MKKGNWHWAIAIVCFAALFLVGFKGAPEEKTISPQIVTLGDSIFGQIRDETGIPVVLSELTGKTIYNGAFGGTCAARMTDDERMDCLRGSLSLVRIAKSISADDFRVQQCGRFRDNLTDYFMDVIDDLEKIDFTEVETVVIQHGVNDYHAGTPIENPENSYDEYTFLGALRTAVKLLREANPDVRIVLVTPAYSWYSNVWKTCEEMDYGGGFLEEYVNAELALAEELDVEVIDMYHDFVPTASWDDCALYSQDGVHPNEVGRGLWAEKIAEVLKK